MGYTAPTCVYKMGYTHQLVYTFRGTVQGKIHKKIRKKGRGCKMEERVQMGANIKTLVHRVILLLFNNLFKDDFTTVIS